MGGLQLVQLESYWGKILALCLTSRANISRAVPRAEEGFLLADSVSASKVLINKTGVGGDLRFLLRERRCSPLSSICTCPSCSLFSKTPKWEHASFITSRITSNKIFAFPAPQPPPYSRQLCAIPSVQGGCMFPLQCLIPFTIKLIYQFWNCSSPRRFNFL